MVDRGGADQLAQEHEEHRVADPEAWRDEGDRENVEGDQEPGQKEVPGRLRGLEDRGRGRSGTATTIPAQSATTKRITPAAKGLPRRWAQLGVERGQNGNADPGSEHHGGVGGRRGHGRVPDHGTKKVAVAVATGFSEGSAINVARVKISAFPARTTSASQRIASPVAGRRNWVSSVVVATG